MLALANERPDLQEKRDKERMDMHLIFENAGLDPVHMRPIENGYCGGPCCIHIPWFIVTSELGPIKIGWRKRVINIDWSDSDVPHNGQEFFEGENTTTGDSYVHAWSDEKASAYLKTLKMAWEQMRSKNDN